jgi:predicted polyphosphate/ATP-dependent NAD kinase
MELRPLMKDEFEPKRGEKVRKVGLLVNPIAGMGGKVGLKGSDGWEIIKKAQELGAQPEAPLKALQALQGLLPVKDSIRIITYPKEMGENIVRQCGFSYVTVGLLTGDFTTAQDTKNAARKMSEAGVELLIFAGGDGTARNVYDIVRDALPVIGIPAGVKIHSAVFATNPRNAGELALLYLENKAVSLRLSEVMDIDEEAFRQGRLSAKLYGYMNIPFERHLVQNLKAGRAPDEDETIKAIADYLIDNMEKDVAYIIGPGTSTAVLLERLQLPSTLLGVDVVVNKEIAKKDVAESDLLVLVRERKAKIVVTVIGGQGYILGRGNQQISADVIRKVGEKNVIVIATKDKIVSLKGQPFLVDTGDDEVNQLLKGYIRVTTGYNEALVYKVSC